MVVTDVGTWRPRAVAVPVNRPWPPPLRADWAKERRKRRVPRSAAVGVLLGLSAAVAGVNSIPAGLPLRPWHLFVIAAFAIAARRRAFDRILPHRIDAAMVLGFVWLVIDDQVDSAALNHPANLVSALSRGFVLLAFYAARLAVADAKDAAWFLRGLVAPAPLVALIGLAQVVGIGALNSFLFAYTSSDGAADRVNTQSLTRASSLIGHWTGLGAYLAAVIACLLMAVFLEGGRFRWYDLALLAVVLVGELATFTFATIITALAIILIGIKGKARVRIVLAAVPVIGVATLVFWSKIVERFTSQQQTSYARMHSSLHWLPNTLAYRVEIWSDQTIPAIAQRPWLGWGLDLYDAADHAWTQYPTTLIWPSAESQWMWSAVTGGIISAVLMAWLVLEAVLLVRRWAGSPEWGAVSPLMTLLLLSTLASLTVPVFTNRGLPGILWPALGAVAFVLTRPEPAARSAAPPLGRRG